MAGQVVTYTCRQLCPGISACFGVRFCNRFLRWGQGTTTFCECQSKPNNLCIASPSSVYTVTQDPTLFSRCLMHNHQPLYTCRDTHVQCWDNTVPNSSQPRSHLTFSHLSPSALLWSWSFFSTIKKGNCCSSWSKTTEQTSTTGFETQGCALVDGYSKYKSKSRSTILMAFH